MAAAGTRADIATADPSTNGRTPGPGGPGRSRRVVVGAAGAIAVVGVAAVVILTGGGDDAATSQASQATRTAEVVRQDLVERDSVDGTLGYSDARTVVNRLAGTVTWTPATGAVVRTNHRLFEVDGEAVYLLDGSYPAYRTLQSGMSGDDIRQLERNLRVLGLDPDEEMRVDGTWDSGTTAAVKRWQARKGMTEDGSIEKGRIVFQPGARRIGAIQLRAGDSASGGGGGGTAPAAFDAASRSTTVFASRRVTQLRSDGFSDIPTARAAQDGQPATTTTPPATTTPSTTTTPPATTTAPPATTTPPTTTTAPRPTTTTAPTTPAPSTAAPSGASRSGAPSGAAPSGISGGGGTATGASAGSATGSDVTSELMTTTSTKRIVAVDLEATDQELASEGDRVVVELPGGDEVDGTIARVGKVAQKKATAQDDDPPATVKVVIKLARPTGTGLDQAPVDVQLERSRAKDVLTVPVTALLARSGGTFAVEVREGTARRVVPVRTGLYTDGYVEVSGEGLREGMTVTDSGV